MRGDRPWVTAYSVTETNFIVCGMNLSELWRKYNGFLPMSARNVVKKFVRIWLERILEGCVGEVMPLSKIRMKIWAIPW